MFTETAPPAASATLYSRKNPFPSRLLTRRKLDGPGSEKETFHYEYSLEGSGLTFEVGDSLGVFPAHAPELAEEILPLLGFTGDELVTGNSGESTPVRTALLRERTLTTPSRLFVQMGREPTAAA